MISGYGYKALTHWKNVKPMKMGPRKKQRCYVCWDRCSWDLIAISWYRLHSNGNYRKSQSDTSLSNFLHFVPQNSFIPRMIHWFQPVQTRRKALVARRNFVRRSASGLIVLDIRTYWLRAEGPSRSHWQVEENSHQTRICGGEMVQPVSLIVVSYGEQRALIGWFLHLLRKSMLSGRALPVRQREHSSPIVDSICQDLCSSDSLVSGPLSTTPAWLAKVATSPNYELHNFRHLICVYIPDVYDRNTVLEVSVMFPSSSH